MLSDLDLSSIVTGDDRDHVVSEIDLLRESLFKQKKTLADNQTEISSTTTSLLKGAKIEAKSQHPEDTDAILSALKKELLDIPVLELTMAFIPPYKFLSELQTIAVTKLGKFVILNVREEPDVLAGARLTFEGMYEDGTLRRLFDLKMTGQKDKILSMLA